MRDAMEALGQFAKEPVHHLPPVSLPLKLHQHQDELHIICNTSHHAHKLQ